MDPTEIWLRLLPVIVMVVALGWTIWVFRYGVRKTEITALEAKLDVRLTAVESDLDQHKSSGVEWRLDIRERVQKIEGTLEQLPDKNAVHKLEVSVEGMRGDVRVQGQQIAGVEDKLKGVAASNQRIEDFLLKGRAS